MPAGEVLDWVQVVAGCVVVLLGFFVVNRLRRCVQRLTELLEAQEARDQAITQALRQARILPPLERRGTPAQNTWPPPPDRGK